MEKRTEEKIRELGHFIGRDLQDFEKKLVRMAYQDGLEEGEILERERIQELIK